MTIVRSSLNADKRTSLTQTTALKSPETTSGRGVEQKCCKQILSHIHLRSRRTFAAICTINSYAKSESMPALSVQGDQFQKELFVVTASLAFDGFGQGLAKEFLVGL